MDLPEIMYGLITNNASCSCCHKNLKGLDAIKFQGVTGRWKKQFVCNECFEIMKQCQDNVVKGE